MPMTGRKRSGCFAILVALVILAETIVLTVSNYANNDAEAIMQEVNRITADNNEQNRR